MKRRPRSRLELASAELQLQRDAGAFLGRLDPMALESELRGAGIFEGLARRGYADVELRTELEGGEHRLRVLPRGEPVPLVDLRLAEASAVLDEPFLARRGLGLVSLLCIHWLALQDPRAAFTAERPRLPGQSYPGLGLARLLVLRVLEWANAWGKDGLLNRPEYFHNAVFYAELFRFVSPWQQGRFLALRRDLAFLALARASAAVERGDVVEQPAGTPFRWEPAEMAAPLSQRLRHAFESTEYRDAVAREQARVSFRLTGG